MIHIKIRAQKRISQLLSCLILAGMLFVLLDATINYAKWSDISQFRRMFNIAREDSLPSWFSVIQLFLVFIAASLNFMVTPKGKEHKFKRIAWALIALFFLFMSADDAAEIHERFGSGFKAFIRSSSAGAIRDAGSWMLDVFPSYPWQFVVGPVFAAFGLFMFYFLWSELKTRRLRLTFFAGLACYVLAVAMDFVEGIEGGHSGIEQMLALDAYTVRHFAKSIEEFIEMLGTSLILVSLLGHFVESAPSLQVELGKE